MAGYSFRKMFDSLASRTFLALLGVVGTIITVYAFLQEKKVDLRYEIVANTNVLDFNADISKLEVTYDSTNLKQTKENLRIYTIRIINKGDQNIIKEYYDENEPIGIKISSGKIIEQPQLIQTSNDYLARNVKFTNLQNDKVNFSQVILEQGEYFTIKLLVLHKTGSIPNILSFGKIAGQKKIDVVNSIDAKKDDSFLIKAFSGNFWVQLLRLFSYLLGAVLIIIIIVTTSEKIDDVRNKNRRIRRIEEFKNLKSYEYTRMDDAIFDRYKANDSHSFQRMKYLLKNEDELNKNYQILKEKLRSKEFRRFRHFDNNLSDTIEPEDFSVINEMITDGILFKEQEKLVINQAMKDTLDKFISFLKEKKEYHRRNFFPISEIELNEKYYNSDEESDDSGEKQEL